MIVLVVMLGLGLVGSAIGKPKGNPVGGFFVGALLGPLGWLFIGLSGPSNKVKAQREAKAQADLAIAVSTAVSTAMAATQAPAPVATAGPIAVPAGEGTIVERFAAQHRQTV